jgi:hypothetical protein
MKVPDIKLYRDQRKTVFLMSNENSLCSWRTAESCLAGDSRNSGAAKRHQIGERPVLGVGLSISKKFFTKRSFPDRAQRARVKKKRYQ